MGTDEEIEEYLSRVDFFPGSIAEYERIAGPVEIIEMHRRDKGVRWQYDCTDNAWYFKGGTELKRFIVEQGISALVNCQIIPGDIVEHTTMYGLPVRLKNPPNSTPNPNLINHKNTPIFRPKNHWFFNIYISLL